MFGKPKTYFYAIGVMTGYVIGIGMFGLPFIVSKSGILGFFIFLAVFGVIQYFIHLVYANLIIVTKGYHRMPGYAEIYLGKAGKIVVFAAKFFGNMGAVLAYIIVTGIFANELFGPVFGGSEFFYGSMLFVFGGIIVFFGISMISRTELFMSALLLVVVCLIAFKGRESIELCNYNLLDWKYFLATYGVMLMALDGNSAVPIVANILKKNKELIKSAVKWGGSIIPIIIISIFTLSIVGISGSGTTPDALVGIKAVLKNGVVFFALAFGILTMTTSFLLVSESIKETLWWDFKVKKNLAWFIAVFTPYIFYVFGFHDLTKVISFVGGVAGGLSAIMLILIFWKLKKLWKKIVIFKYIPGDFVIFSLVFIFFMGMLYEIYYFLIK